MKISAAIVILGLFSVLSSTSAEVCSDIVTNKDSACNGFDGGGTCKWVGKKNNKMCGDKLTCENNTVKWLCHAIKTCKWNNSEVAEERFCSNKPIPPGCDTLTDPEKCKKFKKRDCKWYNDVGLCKDKPKKTQCSQYQKPKSCKKPDKDVGPHCKWNTEQKQCEFKTCDAERYGKKKKCLNNPTCKWVNTGEKGDGRCVSSSV